MTRIRTIRNGYFPNRIEWALGGEGGPEDRMRGASPNLRLLRQAQFASKSLLTTREIWRNWRQVNSFLEVMIMRATVTVEGQGHRSECDELLISMG